MATNQVRIIGGEFRSRLLRFPDAPGLRPSTDRVRETLFNWLGQDLTGRRCLDLFAGSGALGFECLSRNARAVTMVEKAPRVHAALVENARLLNVTDRLELVRGDALGYLSATTTRFDLVLLDPPFNQGLLERVLPGLGRVLDTDALVYIEAEAEVALPDGWAVQRSGRAGAVYYQLIRQA